MKRFTHVIVTICLLAAAAFAQVDHTPVATAVAGQPIAIAMKSSLPSSEITRAAVYFRATGELSWRDLDLTLAGDRYVAEIPASIVKERGVEYYLSITKKSGGVETLPPSSGAPSSPFSVTVRAASGAQAGSVSFQVVTPDPSEPVSGETDVVVSVAVLGGTLDVATARLEVDGAAVTKWAVVTPELVSYIAKDLTTGSHSIRMSGSTPSGYVIPTMDVSFKFVKEGEEERTKKPVEFAGNFWSETRLEKIETGTSDTKDWWQREGLNFQGRLGALDFGGKFYMTNEERTYQQPRDRYQFWMGTKWFKLGVGDNNPEYTPLTVSGKRVRGIQLELHGGPAHLEFVTGQTEKALTDYGRRSVAFARELTGIRNWYGSKDGGHGGFTVVKVRDQRFSTNRDSASALGILPQENLVISTDLQMAFNQRRILIYGEGALSLYNRDIGPGAISKDSLKNLPGAPTMPFDPLKYQKYFVLNQNLIPLNPADKTNLAYYFGASFNYFNNLLSFKARTTGSSFYSLANSMILRDDRGYNVSDRVRLLDNRLFVTVGYETAENNLDQNSSTATIKQGTMNFDISYYPPMEMVPDMSFSMRSGDRKNDKTTIDTTRSTGSSGTVVATAVDNRVKEKLSSMTFYAAKSFRAWGYDHSASLTYNSFKRDDQYTRTGGSPYGSSSGMSFLNWKTTWNRSLNTTFSFSSMKMENPVGVNSSGSVSYTMKSTTYTTIGLRGDRSWMQDKLSSFLAYTTQSASGEMQYSKSMISFGGAYTFPYKVVARLQADLNSTKFSGTNSGKADETFAFLRLERSF